MIFEGRPGDVRKMKTMSMNENVSLLCDLRLNITESDIEERETLRDSSEALKRVDFSTLNSQHNPKKERIKFI